MDTNLIVGKLVLMADVVDIIMLTDVMPLICGRCYCHLCWLCGRWKAMVVDVMTTCIGWLAGVIVIAADGIATLVVGRCYCHCGRWDSHTEWNDFDYDRCYCLCGRWNGYWVNCFIYYFYFILFYFEFWDVEQNLTPYLRQMVFAYVFI